MEQVFFFSKNNTLNLFAFVRDGGKKIAYKWGCLPYLWSSCVITICLHMMVPFGEKCGVKSIFLIHLVFEILVCIKTNVAAQFVFDTFGYKCGLYKNNVAVQTYKIENCE